METATIDQILKLHVTDESWAEIYSSCSSIVPLNENLFLSLSSPLQLVKISFKDGNLSLVKKVKLEIEILDLTVFNGLLIGRESSHQSKIFIFDLSTLSMSTKDVSLDVWRLSTNGNNLFIGSHNKVLMMGRGFRDVSVFKLNIRVLSMYVSSSMIACRDANDSMIVNIKSGLAQKINSRWVVGLNESFVILKATGDHFTTLRIYSLSRGLQEIKSIDCGSPVYDVHFLDHVMLVGTKKCLQVFSLDEFRLLKAFDGGGVGFAISSEGRAIATRYLSHVSIYEELLNDIEISKTDPIVRFDVCNETWAPSHSRYHSVVLLDDYLFLSMCRIADHGRTEPTLLVKLCLNGTSLSLVRKVKLKQTIYNLTNFNSHLIGRHFPQIPKIFIFDSSTLKMKTVVVPIKVYCIATNGNCLFIGGEKLILEMDGDFKQIRTFYLDIVVFSINASSSVVGCSDFASGVYDCTSFEPSRSRIIDLKPGSIDEYKFDDRVLADINEAWVTFCGKGDQGGSLFFHSTSNGRFQMESSKKINCGLHINQVHLVDQMLLVGTDYYVGMMLVGDEEFRLLKRFKGTGDLVSSTSGGNMTLLALKSSQYITIFTSNLDIKPVAPMIKENVYKLKDLQSREHDQSGEASHSLVYIDPAIVQQLEQRIKELEDRLVQCDLEEAKMSSIINERNSKLKERELKGAQLCGHLKERDLQLKEKELKADQLSSLIKDRELQLREKDSEKARLSKVMQEIAWKLKEVESDSVNYKLQAENFKKQWDLSQSSKVEILDHYCPKVIHPNRVSLSFDILGVGGMGIVVSGKFDGKPAAIKQVSNPSDMTKEQVETYLCESGLMAAVRHPYIIPLLGVLPMEETNMFSLILPKMVSNLKGFYLKEKITLETKLDIMSKVANGMVYLHRHGIIHRDLKPQNILMDEQGDPQISDFGLARISAGTVDSVNSAGTMYYMSPECFMEGTISKAGDVYAFGIILAEIILEKIPFNTNIPAMAFPTVMVQGNAQFEMPNEPKEVRSLIEKCVQKDRSKRPSFEEIEEVLKGIK